MMRYLIMCSFVICSFNKVYSYGNNEDEVIFMGQSHLRLNDSKIKWKCILEFYNSNGECKIAIGYKACFDYALPRKDIKEGFYITCKERKNHKNIKTYYYKRIQ